MHSENEERRRPMGSGVSGMSLPGRGADTPDDSKGAMPAQSLDFPARSRRSATGDTSRAAAAFTTRTAAARRQVILDMMKEAGRPTTAEMITRMMVQKGLVPTSGYPAAVVATRPRLSELARQGVIEDSGTRGDALGGTKAVAWQLVPEARQAAAAARYAKPGAKRPIVDEKTLWTAAFKEAAGLLAQGRRPIEVLARVVFDRMVLEGRTNG